MKLPERRFKNEILYWKTNFGSEKVAKYYVFLLFEMKFRKQTTPPAPELRGSAVL